MSVFSVNTNILSMNALRSLGVNGSSLQMSMNRLSTGSRITSAGDDPAGLIVSETFRAQIAGIDQALRNNQDAINFTKTAEAAMDEAGSLLRDARALAIASGNTATLTDAQRQANQNQLNSIVSSITRIAQTTTFGTKKILDGSSGTVAVSTSGANVQGMSFSGVFGGDAVTANSTVTIDVTTPATRATTSGGAGFATFAFATTTVSAGSFTVNGLTFTTSSSDTVQTVLDRINQTSAQTNVTASFTAGGAIVLNSSGFGSDAKVQLVDSNGILKTAAGSFFSVGVDAVADVTIDNDGAGSAAPKTVSFASGKGLTLRDIYGNMITLTEAGNASSSAGAWGYVTAGAATFQIGSNADQQTGLSIGNFAATELGRGSVPGKDMSNISILSADESSTALQVIDKAINDIAVARGSIGNFTRNVLESNVRSLAVQRENLTATDSSIRDVDVAAEMTNLTKFQIIQQSGIAMLAQANQVPQAVLRLLQ